MSDPIGPYSEPLGYQRRALGSRRFDEFIQHNGRLQLELMSLTMSITSAPGLRYGDEVLAAIRVDARDLLAAASAYAKWAEQLAADWRDQRTDNPTEGADAHL